MPRKYKDVIGLSNKTMEIKLQAIQKPRSNVTLEDNVISFNNCDVVVIGREASCDLMLECDEKIISRRHARISKIGNVFKLTDTSANGTYLNNQNQPLGNGNSVDIYHNDIIRLGNYALKISFPKQQIRQHPTEAIKKVKYEQARPSDKKTKHTRSQGVPTKKNTVESKSYKRNANIKGNSGNILGNANANFSPPNITIPENWDMSFSATKTIIENNVPEKLKKPLNFSEQHSNNDTILLKSLLKGLGMSKQEIDTQLTADNMVALGRCVRVSIAGMIKQRDQSDKIKSKLCFDENSMLKALNYSSFADFKNTEEFLKALLSPKQKTHSEFPLEVMRCQKELMEDQAAIYKSYNKAIDSFREELSPFKIETLFHEKQKSSTNIAEILVPSIGKWDIYKKQWSEKCLNFKKIIKKNFEENIKLLHTKRINERQLINKNKK